MQRISHINVDEFPLRHLFQTQYLTRRMFIVLLPCYVLTYVGQWIFFDLSPVLLDNEIMTANRQAYLSLSYVCILLK